jgi:hypothetical protein
MGACVNEKDQDRSRKIKTKIRTEIERKTTTERRQAVRINERMTTRRALGGAPEANQSERRTIRDPLSTPVEPHRKERIPSMGKRRTSTSGCVCE